MEAESKSSRFSNFTSILMLNYYFYWSFIVSLLAGGMAGIVVDIGLFPIDTLKTRIQSGKLSVLTSKSNIYNGLTSTLLGSFPSAGAFFISYDFTNYYIMNSKFKLSKKMFLKYFS